VSGPAGQCLLRGAGPDLGPLVTRLPPDRRTLLHVLELHSRERPDHDWLVFDGRDRLTFAGARQAAHRFAAALLVCIGARNSSRTKLKQFKDWATRP